MGMVVALPLSGRALSMSLCLNAMNIAATHNVLEREGNGTSSGMSLESGLGAMSPCFTLENRGTVSDARLTIAAARLRAAQGDLESGIRMLTPLVQAQDQSTIAGLASYQLGLFFERRRHYEDAIESLKNAHATWPLIKFGGRLVVAREYRTALVAYRVAIELAPRQADSYVRAANVCEHQLADLKCASEFLHLGLDSGANLFLFYTLNGALSARQGNFDEAETQYNLALQSSPERRAEIESLIAENRVQKREQLISEGKWAAAIEVLESELIAQPGNKEVRLRLAGVYLWSGNVTQAKDQYDQVLRLAPGDVRAYLGLGDAARVQGQFSEAETWYRKALEVEPTSTYPYFGLGRASLDLGYVSIALEYLQRASSGAPQDAIIRYWLGQAYCQDGRTYEAWQEFSEAVRLDSENQTFKDGLKSAIEGACEK